VGALFPTPRKKQNNDAEYNLQVISSSIFGKMGRFFSSYVDAIEATRMVALAASEMWRLKNL
jgi:hypothetical protein